MASKKSILILIASAIIAMLLFVLLIMFDDDTSSMISLEKVGNYSNITWINDKMVLSKDDKYLFVVNQDTANKIDILDLSDLTKPKLLKQIVLSDNSKDRIMDCKMTHDGRYLFVSINDKIVIYNLENLENIQSINKIALYTKGTSGSLAVTPDGKYLYAVGKDDGEYGDVFIHIYNIQNIKSIKDIGKYQQDAYMLTISPDSKKLVYGVVGSEKSRIELMDITRPTQIKKLDEYSRYFNNRLHFPYSVTLLELLFSQNSNKLYLVGAEAGIIIFDINKNKLNKVGRFSNDSPLSSLGIINNKNYALMNGSNYKKPLQKINSFDNLNEGLLFLGSNITVSNSEEFFLNLGLGEMGINIYQINQ